MVDAGYFAKLIEPTPPGLGVPAHVVEICSASQCISSGADDALEKCLPNWLGWYDTPELAWAVVPEADRPRYRLFAYRLHDTYFHQGDGVPVVLSEDAKPAPIPPGYRSLGFDAVSKFMESGPGL